MKEYWAIYACVLEILTGYDLSGTDTFIDKIVNRVQTDADDNWNTDDVRIAIRNELNEMIEKFSGAV